MVFMSAIINKCLDMDVSSILCHSSRDVESIWKTKLNIDISVGR